MHSKAKTPDVTTSDFELPKGNVIASEGHQINPELVTASRFYSTLHSEVQWVLTYKKHEHHRKYFFSDS